MYFSFDGNTEGFEKILSRIADNHDGGKHNHKEVRAYARCLLCILPEIKINVSVKPEVQILLAALTASGLPHYDRAFLATCSNYYGAPLTRILKVLPKMKMMLFFDPHDEIVR